MDPADIAAILTERFPGQILGTVTHAGQVGVSLAKEVIRDVCLFLRDEPTLRMDHLADLTAVDYSRYPGDTGPRFEVVYNLFSTVHRHRIRLKVRLAEDDPRIATVSAIWHTADWHERETFDLMGIVFENHPDLRRILLPEDWTGHPLRKEYPLKGY